MTKQLANSRAALRGRIRANRLVAIALLLLLGLTAFFWHHGNKPRRHALRITAGDRLSHRHTLAEILCEEARKHDVDLELVSTQGSQESLALLAAGELDIALTLGDFDIPDEHLRQVAMLNTEVMHLFVKPELVAGGLVGLRGKTLSLSSSASNTQKISRHVLAAVGLESGRDFVEKDYSNSDLHNLTAEELPDGIFAITSLPWVEVGELLVKQHNYRLLELPFGDAFSLRNPSVLDMTIPAFSYSIDPPVPERPLHTIGQRLLILANRDTPEAAVVSLMKIVFESEFGRRARLATLDATAVVGNHEFPLHAGTRRYLNRNEPLIRADVIDKLENLRSFMVSAALALFLFWRWQKRRNMIGFETYIDAVSEIEMAALAMERQQALDFAALHTMRGRLTEVKSEALERQSEGVLRGEEQMASFLTHVVDVRNYLEALVRNEPQRASRLGDSQSVNSTVRTPPEPHF